MFLFQRNKSNCSISELYSYETLQKIELCHQKRIHQWRIKCKLFKQTKCCYSFYRIGIVTFFLRLRHIRKILIRVKLEELKKWLPNKFLFSFLSTTFLSESTKLSTRGTVIELLISSPKTPTSYSRINFYHLSSALFLLLKCFMVFFQLNSRSSYF